MDQFLGNYKLVKWIHEDIKKPENPVTSKKLNPLFHNFPSKKPANPDCFISEWYSCSIKNNCSFTPTLPENGKRNIFSNLFCEGNIGQCKKQSNLDYNNKCKNFRQHISKLNQALYKKVKIIIYLYIM